MTFREALFVIGAVPYFRAKPKRNLKDPTVGHSRHRTSGGEAEPLVNLFLFASSFRALR
jgi:hypothetical protein